MQDNKISQRQILRSLLRADARVQRRQSRSILMSTLFALIILFTWRGFVGKSGLTDWQHVLLATCLSIVLAGMGILGYPALVARDRDNGVFQRLRVTPASSSSIMLSRLVIQALVIGTLSVTIMIVAAADQITLTPVAYLLTLCASVLGSVMYLSVGQLLVALIASQSTLNATGRVIYFPVVMFGGLAELHVFGSVTEKIVAWSPYGTVQSVMQAAMQPAQWSVHTWLSLVVTLAYTALFAVVGIRYFRWVSKA